MTGAHLSTYDSLLTRIETYLGLKPDYGDVFEERSRTFSVFWSVEYIP